MLFLLVNTATLWARGNMPARQQANKQTTKAYFSVERVKHKSDLKLTLKTNNDALSSYQQILPYEVTFSGGGSAGEDF